MKEKKELKRQKIQNFFSKYNVTNYQEWNNLEKKEKSELLKKFYLLYKNLWNSKNSLGVEVREYFKTGTVSGDNSDLGDFSEMLATKEEIKKAKKRINRKTMHEFEEKMDKKTEKDNTKIEDVSESMIQNVKALEESIGLIDGKDLALLIKRMTMVVNTSNKIITKIITRNDGNI